MHCAQWNDDYCLGIQEIDDQHRRLFSLINTLCNNLANNESPRTAIAKGIQKSTTEEVLAEMTDYASSHFVLEEKCFEDFHYLKKDEHVAQHELFRRKVDSLKSDLEKGKDSVALDTLAYLSNWFVEHILHFDRGYVECFHEHGL